MRPLPIVLGLAQEKELRRMSQGPIAPRLLSAVFMILVPPLTLSPEPREGSSSKLYPGGATTASSLSANIRLSGIALRGVERAALLVQRVLSDPPSYKSAESYVEDVACLHVRATDLLRRGIAVGCLSALGR